MDPTAYIKAMIEEAERQLTDQGMPPCVIHGYAVELLDDRDVIYETPIRMLTTSGHLHWFNVEALQGITESQRKLAQLIAVAKAWLDVFGTRTQGEFALAMEWQRLEQECFSQMAVDAEIGRKVKDGGKKGHAIALANQKRHQYQDEINKVCLEHLDWKITAIRKKAADNLGISLRTKSPSTPGTHARIPLIETIW